MSAPACRASGTATGTLFALSRDSHRDELPPYAERNAIKALAALWQVANGAGRRPGDIYDLGA
jgi:hypothetical protein